MPDRAAVEAREADDDVRGEVLVHLEEVAVVHHAPNHVLHVVGLVRPIPGTSVSSRPVAAIDRVGGTARRGGSSTLFCGRNESRRLT